jgi:hypothetical protein
LYASPNYWGDQVKENDMSIAFSMDGSEYNISLEELNEGDHFEDLSIDEIRILESS